MKRPRATAAVKTVVGLLLVTLVVISSACGVRGTRRWIADSGITISYMTAYTSSAYNVPHLGENPDWGYDPTTILMCRFKSGIVGKTASIDVALVSKTASVIRVIMLVPLPTDE